jgi:hypothetical protein
MTLVTLCFCNPAGDAVLEVRGLQERGETARKFHILGEEGEGLRACPAEQGYKQTGGTF